MYLKLIGSNFRIKNNNINNAAHAIIHLKDEGTTLDNFGNICYNDIDNDAFRNVCQDCLNKNAPLEYHDFNNLMNIWNWCVSPNNVGDIDDIDYSTLDFIIDHKSEDPILFQAIAPYVDDYSYLLFVREDFDNKQGANNTNFVRWDFHLGRLCISECSNMTYILVNANSQYDCFNQVKTLFVNIPIGSGAAVLNFPVKYSNPGTTMSTTPPDLSSPSTNKTIHYGGHCKICKLYDDYAVHDEFGDVICYKCI